MTLTNEERAIFATYLETDVKSSELLIEQMEKLPGLEPLIKRTKIEIAGVRLIINKLKNTQIESV